MSTNQHMEIKSTSPILITLNINDKIIFQKFTSRSHKSHALKNNLKINKTQIMIKKTLKK